jgi:signal transduction histidine kinase
MASHEFRTPLTTIVSSADLLEYRMDRMTDEQKRKHFRKVQDSARHMTQLLDDVLTIGKADAGWLEIRPAPLDLRVLCEDVLEEIQLDVRPGLSIRFTSEGACGGVIADEKLMRNILSNLLSNAVKYSPHGGTVHLDLHCGGEDITIRVQDEGIGVPEKDQPRLFESFHRAENVGAIKGTGLGLAIVKRAVGLHGGTVRFTSEEGIGTTFTVVIPRASTVGEVDR